MTTLYLTEPGTVVQCRNQALLIRWRNQERLCRLSEIELVVILPGIQVSSGALAELLDRGIETIFLRADGSFRGRLQGPFSTYPELRLAQYQRIHSPWGLEWACKIVRGKIRNQRAILQLRNRATRGRIAPLQEGIDVIAAYLQQLDRSVPPLERETLMGLEGICARTYYQSLRHYFPPAWKFTGRNRQPPLDPINALLSWGYGVLLARVFSAVVMAGLDPYLGFFHANLPYRPNLVLDMMEEFRPLVVDWAVIQVIKAELLTPEDFEPSPDGTGIWLGSLAKKLFLGELERRFREPLFYPPQSRRLALSQIVLEQARWLSRCLISGDLDYEAMGLR
ncbi:CRISPR-associated endonuclease Cas1 [Thermostichus vulcanus]|uniref:CRISPR-associated endonuclease Cas1 n=1 Tax=Thermostichus vulcanus str. 'Rupite' TaxID=2813851 RepID=A0ABT0C9G3_THEVL|nr:CRISPR-associated endonuclease Cas1 [Thermostichus vulcanus]MCJ2542415.1 CRISPR-associated endonuclease Cas1 [Thermostichus vulcanus str. 'Rupite']